MIKPLIKAVIVFKIPVSDLDLKLIDKLCEQGKSVGLYIFMYIMPLIQSKLKL